MSSAKFPIITLEGSPEEIGIQHGEILKNKIHSTVTWYKKVISKEEKQILTLVEIFKLTIENFDPTYASEIEAIATGADINSNWIYMLNSRSEIMNIFQNECTAAFFKSSAILGQNWDWAEDLENLAVIMKIKKQDDNKPDILMMTEPGIIGKIGFNSNGLGVCLNFLNSGKLPRGVPIHILLRKVLELSSINQVGRSIGPFMSGKSANILIGEKSGEYIDIEFANDEHYYPNTTSDAFIHTNHYLMNNALNSDTEKLASSFSRYNKALNIIKNNPSKTVEDMKGILLDRTNKALPICRPYVDNPDIGTVGTICTIIMDLKNGKMHITKGSPLNTPFSSVEL